MLERGEERRERENRCPSGFKNRDLSVNQRFPRRAGVMPRGERGRGTHEHRGEETREGLNERWTGWIRGEKQGSQPEFLWPQLRDLQSLKCSAVSMPAFTGHVTNEMKQHDMSVFRIKEETSNQHTRVYTSSLPPSLSSSLHPSLWWSVIPSVAGMTPSLSLYLPLFV